MNRYKLIYINKDNQEVIIDTFNDIFTAEARTRGALYEGLYVVDREPYDLTPELVRVEHRYYSNPLYMHNIFNYKGFTFTLISNKDKNKYFNSGVYLHQDQRTKDKPYFKMEASQDLSSSMRNMQKPENLVKILDKLISEQ